MFDSPDFYGPHWDASLIAPNGELARLHKGAKPQKAIPPPPPVRESAAEVQMAKEDERLQASKRRGYNQTLLGGTTQPGSKTLLG